MKNKRVPTKRPSKAFKWIKLITGILIILLFVKGFVFDLVFVNDRKMEKTLLPGDFLIINKICYGARLPITLLSVPFFPQYYSELIMLPVLRIPGIGHPKSNDLVAFNFPGQQDPPIDKKNKMVKRLIGLPGDTVVVHNKELFVNGNPFPEPFTLQHNFRLTARQNCINKEFLELYDIHEGGEVSEFGLYEFPLTKEISEKIVQNSCIINLRVLKDFPNENVKYIFPLGYFYHFNKDYFGPIVVPYAGMQVYLDTHSIELYAEIIDFYEGNELTIKDFKIFINGIETTHYTIKKNYYFVMDDNRDNAKDSRYWGFLPENHMLGKAVMVVYSRDQQNEKMRWNRTFVTF